MLFAISVPYILITLRVRSDATITTEEVDEFLYALVVIVPRIVSVICAIFHASPISKLGKPSYW